MTNWYDLEGAMTYRGIDLPALPLHRLVNLLQHLLLRNASEQDRIQIIDWLERPLSPLPGRGEDDVDDGVWSDEEMASGFQSMMSLAQQYDPDSAIPPSDPPPSPSDPPLSPSDPPPSPSEPPQTQ